MKFIQYKTNFIPKKLLLSVWDEINLIEPNLEDESKTGSAVGKKTGKGIIIPQEICAVAFPHITSLKESVDKLSNFTFLLNHYSDGEGYGKHTDTSKKTLNVVLSKETNSFVGGDFIFPEENIKYQFEHNSAIYFDSSLEHEVTPVESKPGCSGRYSLTFFLY